MPINMPIHSRLPMSGKLLSVAVMAAVSPLPALAQPALEEVIVTATKRQESTQDIPIAISSFTASDLKGQGAVRLEDITFHVPNMLTNESPGNSGGPRFAIRGQAVDDVVGTVDQPIGIYVDDFFYSRPSGTNMNLSDIERIEVLRGPQGTLFGRNTTGGAILIHTKDPHDDWAYRVGFGTGNYGQSSWNVMLNAPVIRDKLAVRVAIDADKHDGYVENVVTGRDVSDEDVINGQVKVLFTPVEDFSALFKFEYGEGDHLGYAQKLVGYTADLPAAFSGGLDSYANYLEGNNNGEVYSGSDGDITYEGNTPKSQFLSRAATTILTWDATDDMTVKFIGGYRNMFTQNDWDIDGTPYPILYTIGSDDGHDQWSTELQVFGDAFDESVDWIVGLYAFHEDGTAENITQIPPTPLDVNPLNPGPDIYLLENNTFGDYDNDSQAVFTQGSWQVTDDFAATVGLRYSDETKRLSPRNYRVFGGDITNPFNQAARFSSCAVAGIGCESTFDRSEDSFDYSVMVEYQFTPDILVYAKYGTGFRSGGFNVRGTSENTLEPFDSESLKEVEVGMKGDFLDRRLRINLALFQSDYTDIQRTTIRASADGTSTENATTNAADATISGVELETMFAATETIQIGLNAGYLDAGYDTFDYDVTVTSGTPPVTTTTTIDRSGERFAGSPRWTASLWAAYVEEISDQMTLSLRTDYSYHSQYQSFVTTNTLGMVTPEKGTWNARATVTIADRLDISLWGKNLTDERYPTAALNVYDPFGAGVAVFSAPRTYGMDVTYRYGE